MRKLLLILLLAILPLQYAWSAAAAYCSHEQEQKQEQKQEQTQHFGHHAHAHQAQAGSHDGDGDGGNDDGQAGGKFPGKAKIHADCAVCHHAVQASLLAGMAPPPDASRIVYPPPSASHFTSHIADGPKKPDWRPAA